MLINYCVILNSYSGLQASYLLCIQKYKCITRLELYVEHEIEWTSKNLLDLWLYTRVQILALYLPLENHRLVSLVNQKVVSWLHDLNLLSYADLYVSRWKKCRVWMHILNWFSFTVLFWQAVFVSIYYTPGFLNFSTPDILCWIVVYCVCLVEGQATGWKGCCKTLTASLASTH